eukprot:4663102-Ditylum_brightwellii.AAC.2
MGTSPMSDIFQWCITNWVSDVTPEPPKLYIDNILAAALHTFEEHWDMMDQILHNLRRQACRLTYPSLPSSSLHWINFIKNHMQHRASILEPIMQLASDKVPFVLGEEQEQVVQEIKRLCAEAIMLV